MKVSLTVLTPGKWQGRSIPIGSGAFLIGRGPQCHLRPAHPMVAERHCAVLTRHGRVFVRDFESESGTFINGQRIHGECRLCDNDELSIGPLTFGICIQGGATTQKISRSNLESADDDSVAAMLLFMETDRPTTGVDLGTETTEAPLASTHADKPVEDNSADNLPARLPPLGKPRPDGYSPSRELMKKLLGGRR